MSEQILVNGSTVLAEALINQGVEYMFGVVGFPVIEVAGIAQANGLKYIGMRNEQAACYAASVIGYLTRRPAVCLTVPGPGLLHALSGMQNANENGWPVIVISGCMSIHQENMGAFQELNQVAASKPYAKFSARPSSIERIPFYVEKAVRMSLYGRPGACYIDLPADFISQHIDSSKVLKIPRCPDAPRMMADPQQVTQAVQLMTLAQRPLVVIGKGAAYGRAENTVRELVTKLQLPFLPTPMAKGVLPDEHSLCVGSARSRALQKADVILLLGARLNWMLHFGHAPRFSNEVKIIQVDICAEELHNNLLSCVVLNGDVDSVTGQLLREFEKLPRQYQFDKCADWWKILRDKMTENQKLLEAWINEPSSAMNYYNSLFELESLMPTDCILIVEGANTMDISRTVLHSSLPRHRLDAGTYGTMGVGCGSAIAAAIWCRDHRPDTRVVCVQGDSAFGFAGMEVETACRYKLPIIFIVVNNNGIGFGMDKDSFNSARTDTDPMLSLLPTSLTPSTHYEQVIIAFGGKGYIAETRQQVREAFLTCLADGQSTSLINIIISPTATKKPQEFHWLTSKL